MMTNNKQVMTEKKAIDETKTELPNSASECYKLWKRDNSVMSRFHLTKMTIKEKNMELFHTMFDMLTDSTHPYVSDKFVNYAAECGATEILEFLINLGHDIWDVMAYHAAKGGHKEIVYDLIKRGSLKDLNFIAYGASFSDNKDLLDSLIRDGANNWPEIACGAAFRGDKELLNEMLSKDSTGIGQIAYNAAYGGHREIIDIIIAKGSDLWIRIAHGAAHGGHLDLMNEMLERYGEMKNSTWEYIVRNAAKGGHIRILKTILPEMYEIEWSTLIMEAAEEGHLYTVNFLLDEERVYVNRRYFL